MSIAKNWSKFAIGLLCLSVITLQACSPKAQDSCGFVQNSYGERVSWNGELPVTLYIHQSFPDEYISALQSAVKTWETALGRKAFNVVSQKISGASLPQKDGYNVIYFLSTWEVDKSSEQARTNIYWIGDQIKEADIRINGKFNYYWNQPVQGTAYNIEALLLHELGHALGLKHNDTGYSVMSTYLSSHNDRVQLSKDDAGMLKCEY